MLKFLLIILLFCAPIIVAVPILLWPNPNCEIMKLKETPIKCVNGKYVSWLVRMNYKVKKYENLLKENNNDDLQCRSDCLSSADCLTIQQSTNSCRTFPLLDEFDNLENSNVMQLACCDKNPMPVIYHNVTEVVAIHVDIKFMKDNVFQCPIGWVKEWMTDYRIQCDTSRGLMEKLDNCNMDVGINSCWEKNCLFLVVNEKTNECFLYNYFLYCSINDNVNDLRFAFLACVKNIQTEIRLPEVTSVFTDCIFKRSDLIGYNGTISKSMQNNLCLNWNVTSFGANHFHDNNNNHNYCRNINNDPKGPWCITSGHYHMEYCSIPKCEEPPIEEKTNKTSNNCQKVTNPKQCNPTDRQWVIVRGNSQKNCPSELLANETVSTEEYCFYACVYHPHCLFAFYNRINNVCQLAKSVVACENQIQLDFVEIVCCLQGEEPIQECQYIPAWFIVLLVFSYIIVMAVYGVWFYLQIKYQKMKEQESISEFDEDYSEQKKKKKSNSYRKTFL